MADVGLCGLAVDLPLLAGDWFDWTQIDDTVVDLACIRQGGVEIVEDDAGGVPKFIEVLGAFAKMTGGAGAVGGVAVDGAGTGVVGADTDDDPMSDKTVRLLIAIIAIQVDRYFRIERGQQVF